ncbi:Inositol phosphorylceramide synthase catalytic subunit AUR1 [Galdieria sulphuraria]|nr:Inositol phosphorylceramide synthase catalytic subunit AUR1 [Galdieria sulphuraria]
MMNAKTLQAKQTKTYSHSPNKDYRKCTRRQKRVMPIFLWLIVYEISAAIPSEYRPRIHVRLLSNIEEMLLGGKRNISYLPHEALSKQTNLAKDIFACIAYSLHAFLPWAMFFYLCCFRSWTHAAHFCWTFGWLNILAVVSHFFLPTAAPWYIKEYGQLEAHYHVPGSAAGLVRIDKALGFPLFESLYKRNKNIGRYSSLAICYLGRMGRSVFGTSLYG